MGRELIRTITISEIKLLKKGLIKSILPRHYVLILEHNWCPFKLGLISAEDPDHVYMQCVDPGAPYTEGGTALFKCRRIARR